MAIVFAVDNEAKIREKRAGLFEVFLSKDLSRSD